MLHQRGHGNGRHDDGGYRCPGVASSGVGGDERQPDRQREKAEGGVDLRGDARRHPRGQSGDAERPTGQRANGDKAHDDGDAQGEAGQRQLRSPELRTNACHDWAVVDFKASHAAALGDGSDASRA